MTASLGPKLGLARPDWLPLRMLILLRWLAIVGQLFAIFIASWVYGFQLPLGLCLLAVSAAMIANFVLAAIYPAAKRLSEAEILAALLFDLAQLATLVFLTGGLTNPFALLMLAPVIVSASALNLRSTLLLGGIAAVLTTLVFFVQMPLVQADGRVFDIPVLFKFGFWLSILIGIAFLGLYARKVSTELAAMSDALFATQMALSREQKLTDLGGVVAAAAHELGTPLATIKLISSEMAQELAGNPALQDDAMTIRAQADRCRDILREMGKAGKDDLLIRAAPLSEVLREAAEPHSQRGKTIHFAMTARDNTVAEPYILRRPEIIHGLRNLIQNAVDFASKNIWIDAVWTESDIRLSIVDDGPGYPLNLLDRIGDPFLRSQSPVNPSRHEYEGMGLGLFIAKTLLERTGAVMSFANAAHPFLPKIEAPERCGAVVEAIWPMSALVANRGASLGENQRN
ncbi:MAG: ActS/PrrB/RegB family redox-sensitive histidine kinase [Cypionkella sp.]|nr:ActS/PrrB/RegB family redox-sensitive histidine kinase [Cypionkella sp.]